MNKIAGVITKALEVLIKSLRKLCNIDNCQFHFMPEESTEAVFKMRQQQEWVDFEVTFDKLKN